MLFGPLGERLEGKTVDESVHGSSLLSDGNLVSFWVEFFENVGHKSVQYGPINFKVFCGGGVLVELVDKFLAGLGDLSSELVNGFVFWEVKDGEFVYDPNFLVLFPELFVIQLSRDEDDSFHGRFLWGGLRKKSTLFNLDYYTI